MTGSKLHRTALMSAVVALSLVLGGVGQAQAASARPVDGHPDLSGTWETGSGIGFLKPVHDAKGNICVIGCAPPPGSPPPKIPEAMLHPDRPVYKPEFKAKVDMLNKEQVKYDPALRCGNPGLPRIGPPRKIIETPGQVVFLYDDLNGSFWKIIPTDGRAHRADAEDSFLGDGVGHWDGDTLVVESTHFNDVSWLIDGGSFHTADMKVVETLKRDGDVIAYQATVYDPAVLAEPWALRARKLTRSDAELLETPPCVEQSIAKMSELTDHHDNPR